MKGAPVQLLKFLCCHSIERGRIGIRESSVIETTSKPYVRKHVQGELLHSGTGGKRPNLRQSLLYSGGTQTQKAARMRSVPIEVHQRHLQRLVENRHQQALRLLRRVGSDNPQALRRLRPAGRHFPQALRLARRARSHSVAGGTTLSAGTMLE